MVLVALVTSEHGSAALAAGGRAFLAAPHAASSHGWRRGRAIRCVTAGAVLPEPPGKLTMFFAQRVTLPAVLPVICGQVLL